MKQNRSKPTQCKKRGRSGAWHAIGNAKNHNVSVVLPSTGLCNEYADGRFVSVIPPAAKNHKYDHTLNNRLSNSILLRQCTRG